MAKRQKLLPKNFYGNTNLKQQKQLDSLWKTVWKCVSSAAFIWMTKLLNFILQTKKKVPEI